ncbi:MAG: hypothetical protein ACOC5T_00605 [Elusimicrobiota bacterium]
MRKADEKHITDVKEILLEKMNDESGADKLAEMLLRGARGGLELDDSFEQWLERFKYNFVWLDRDDYSKALVRALWLAPVFAGTDFGSSRQRDMGQVWTDTARGFLGEIAFTNFLKKKFNIQTKLDTRRGDLTEFLPTDIAEIKMSGKEWRSASLKVSMKTTKFNGRWLDVPGAQFEHSDVFVLIKVGILRHHFLAFLKAISFLKDKLFVSAKSLGELSENDAKELWDEIPEFEPIPAYIPGFLEKREINLPIHMVNAKVRGRKHIRISISQGIGLFSPSSIRNNEEIKKLDPRGELRIEIDPIIDSLTGVHFFAHSGGLSYGKKEWEELLNKL